MGLFSSKAKKVNWKEMEKMMQMQLEANRTNLHGLFGNWDWVSAPGAGGAAAGEGGTGGGGAGSHTQQFTLDPKLLAAKQRLMDRASTGVGMEDYKSPPQFAQMLDAAMAHNMARQGIPGASPSGQGYGPPSAEREGRFAQAWVPPPPPAAAPAVPAAAAPAAAGGLPPGFDIRQILGGMGGMA